MLRPVLVAAVLLATFSTSLACDLTSARSLTTCVNQILESSRPALKAKFDPLPLNNATGSGNVDWWISNVRMHGLGDYYIQHLSVIHSAPLIITLRFAVLWPSLVANATGKFNFCKKLLGNNRCFTLTCKPQIIADAPSGSMETRLRLAHRNGTLQVTPSGTGIRINLYSISVEVNLDGILGLVDEALGYPSKTYVTQLSTRWWHKNKKKVESKAKNQLHRLIYKHLSSKLEVQLRGAGR